jgi:6-pyruvoyltetrahydropterin/6-carboxytetrahydropterin synthase
METYKEFTFEAAHKTAPFEGLHGHSFRVRVVLSGAADPVYGWSHNLYVVEDVIDDVRGLLDHKYLNDIEGLAVPTIENVAIWIWRQLGKSLAGIERIEVSRGSEGHAEGCILRDPPAGAASIANSAGEFSGGLAEGPQEPET